MKNFNRKKRMRKVLSCIAIFVLLFGFTGCSKKTPREALEEAYQKTFTSGSPTESLLGLREINETLKDNKAHSSGFSMRLQSLSAEGLEQYAGLLTGLGITVDSASDLLNRKGSGTMNITYGGTTYLTLDGQLQGSKLHLSAPQLLNGNFMVNLSTLKEDLASDSMLAQIIRDANITLPDDVLSGLPDFSFSPAQLLDLNKLTSSLEDLDQDITVEKLKKKDVTLPENISAKSFYKVIIPEESYMEVIHSAKETLSESASTLSDGMGDIVISVAVTKKGYICYAESEFGTDTERFSVTAAFTGEKHPLEESEIDIEISSKDSTVQVTYEESFDIETNEFTVSTDIKENQKTVFSLACDGAFTDVDKGVKYRLDFNYIEFEMADNFSVSLAGDCYVDTSKCEISGPTGPEYGLLTMSSQEFTGLFFEILTNIQNDPLLSELLRNIDLGMSFQ